MVDVARRVAYGQKAGDGSLHLEERSVVRHACPTGRADRPSRDNTKGDPYAAP